MRCILPSLCLLLTVLAPISSAQIIQTQEFPPYSEDVLYVPAGEITRIPSRQLLDNDPYFPGVLNMVEFVLTATVPEVELAPNGDLVIDPGSAQQARFRLEYALKLGIQKFGHNRAEVVVVPRWQPVSITFRPFACGNLGCLTWFNSEQQRFKACELTEAATDLCQELPADVSGEGPYIPINMGPSPQEPPALYDTQTGLLHKLTLVNGKLEEQLIKDLELPLPYYPVLGDWDGDGVPTAAGYDTWNRELHLEADASPFWMRTASTDSTPLVSSWAPDLGESLGLWDNQTGEIHYLVDNTEGVAGFNSNLALYSGAIPFAGFLEDGRAFIGFFEPDEGLLEVFSLEKDGRPSTYVRVPVDPNGGGE